MKLILNLAVFALIGLVIHTTLASAESQDNVDDLFKKGLEATFKHKYDEAIQYFDKVLEINPKNVDALNNKAAALIKLAKYDEAIQYLDKILEIDPKNAVALSNKKTVINRDIPYSISQENKGRLSIFVQIQIRNSAGQLVGYIESDRIRIPDPELLGIVLDTTTVGKSTFTQNGQNFVRNEISTIGEYDGDDTVVSKTGYTQGETWLIYADHDGYPLVKGDQTISLWTIIRPHL